MRIVISDSSALIDLAKVKLIENLLRLPYEFVIPDVMFHDELLDLKHYTRAELRELGFHLGSLEGGDVATVVHYRRDYPGLSLPDCFAVVLAEITGDSILLTGDGGLRKIGGQHGLEVRGVLWACDEMADHDIASYRELHLALTTWQGDSLVRLPEKELQAGSGAIDGSPWEFQR